MYGWLTNREGFPLLNFFAIYRSTSSIPLNGCPTTKKNKATFTTIYLVKVDNTDKEEETDNDKSESQHPNKRPSVSMQWIAFTVAFTLACGSSIRKP
jgi:hypothetical protein